MKKQGLSDEQIAVIRQLRDEGLRPSEIADRLNVSRPTVTKFLKEETFEWGSRCPITGLLVNTWRD